MSYIVLANRHRGEMVEARLSLRERLSLSRFLIPPFIIFAVVMGSLYMGWATPTESASLGVIMALGFAATVGRFGMKILHHCFRQTAAITGMIILIICGSFILNVTLNFLSIPQVLTKFVTSLGVGPTEIVFILIVFYLILGCFLEVLSMQVTTIPIAYPIVTALGIDPIWFGIFIVLMSEVALITPPVGMNLYVVQSIRSDNGPINDVINGVWPYVVMMLGFTVFLWYVPEVVLWLPRNMF
jgi:tripartite ATP-independent transporter DctM subunit